MKKIKHGAQYENQEIPLISHEKKEMPFWLK